MLMLLNTYQHMVRIQVEQSTKSVKIYIYPYGFINSLHLSCSYFRAEVVGEKRKGKQRSRKILLITIVKF